MKQPKLNSEGLRNHFAYSWWSYVVFGVLLVMFWSFAYSATRYVPPADKSIYVNFIGAYVPDAMLNDLTQQAQEAFPEMELIELYGLQTSQDDSEMSNAVQQKVMVTFAAGEGDVFMLDRGLFLSYANIGVFEPLDDLIAEGGPLYGKFTEDEIKKCTMEIEDDDTGAHCLGLPAERFYAYYDYGVDPSRYVLTRASYSQNPEYADKMVCLLVEQGMQGEPPAWLEESAQIEDKSRDEAAQIAPIG